jgi:hypothetical protein
VLFPKGSWPGLTDGTITVAFRRWARPTVKAGGTLQSPGGLLAIDEVAIIEPAEITDADARAAGYAGADEAIAGLRPHGDLYRIQFHRIGEDPRAALRRHDQLTAGDLAELEAKLARLVWAVPTLRLIAEHPGVVSTELAPALGLDRLPFKQRVRRLKELGLTESLKVGYRLSPRGDALLAALGPD